MAGAVGMGDLKKGIYLTIDNSIWNVTKYEHVKPGKGAAFVRIKTKNMTTGQVVERTIRAGDTLYEADVSYAHMSFLYSDGEEYHFMDQSTYEQVAFNTDLLGSGVNYLLEGMEVDVVVANGKPIGVNLPVKVDLKVMETESVVSKGDTVSNVTKPAKVETGITVQVPPFINEGDTITVDTRDGSYVTRASTA